MKSADLRRVRFVREERGYDAFEVEQLLLRVAEAIDADESPRTLIEDCRLSIARRGCTKGDVDLLLDEVLADASESAYWTARVDRWREFDVGNRILPTDNTTIAIPNSPAARQGPTERRRPSAKNEWEDLDRSEGTHLRYVDSLLTARRLEADRLLATIRSSQLTLRLTLARNGKSYTLRRVSQDRRSEPQIGRHAELSRDASRGRYANGAESDHMDPPWARPFWRFVVNNPGGRSGDQISELTDDSIGSPVLWYSGNNFHYKATTLISLPDGRWFRFPVRGQTRGAAVMTAVDESLNRVIRYKKVRPFSSHIKVVVNPHFTLTDDIVLAIALTAPLVSRYFNTPSPTPGG
jgi:hypothetical protein